jgi:murein DD-endopeptidase MepM/ murein hydrolase activator NlpD
MVTRLFVLLVVLLLLAGAGLAAKCVIENSAIEQQFAKEARLAAELAAEIQTQAVHFSELVVPRGQPLATFLLRLGIDPTSVAAIVESAGSVYDLRRIRAGNRVVVGRTGDGELRSVRYHIDGDRLLWIAPAPQENAFRAEIRTIPSTLEVAGVVGEIRDSLFNAVAAAGEGPQLALELADIFGWDLDFYTDPRPGDTFRVVVEKKRYLNGEDAGYGRILAAEYTNAGHAYQAVLFRDPAGHAAYYAPDGKSLKKAFLRSPLKFSAPITSRFSRSRFHPILKRPRAHLGVDYGAPAGTPVQAIGDGRVVFAGQKGGAGRMIHLRHANGFESQYLHLSSIVVRPGERVVQGQLIGRVGSTGLSTGPHLDFRVLQNGAYRNFLALRLPPAQPVARADWTEFAAARDDRLAQLPSLDVLRARTDRAAPAASAQ